MSNMVTVVPDTFLLATSSQAKGWHTEPITDAYKVTMDVPEVVRVHPWLAEFEVSTWAP
jgi:hypothetical protein